MREGSEHQNLLIFDTGGGSTPTVKSQAWTVLADTGMMASLQGYGPGTPITRCRVVHAITKARIQGEDDPILLKVHHASLLEGPDEDESLMTLMDMIKSGVTVNGVTPSEYMPAGSDPKSCGITIEQTYIPFEYDDKKVFFTIEKPSNEDLTDGVLETFEVNGVDAKQLGIKVENHRRATKEHHWQNIPTAE